MRAGLYTPVALSGSPFGHIYLELPTLDTEVQRLVSPFKLGPPQEAFNE